LYVFYTPYHLCHFEVPLTVARAVLFGDATVAPLGGPVCDVITVAKRDLRAGEILDGIGGYTCYGVLDNFEASRAQNLLPMGLAEDCRLKHDIFRDQAISYSDVEIPDNRLCDRLRHEQNSYFTQSGV
jgi:predicted homoserine dehydrogenase-like protein